MKKDVRKQSGSSRHNKARRGAVAVLRWVLVATPGVLSSTAGAWDFSGFASAGGGVLNRDNLTFIDYNDRPSFDSDAIVGLQLQQELFDRWSITTQVSSRGYRSDGHSAYDPDLEWLFLSYQWTAGLRVRAGRLRTPLFLHSEDLEVGYAYPWVRPPVDVYALNVTPFANYEGVDLTHVGQLFDADLETQLFLGSHDEKYLSADVSTSLMYGLAAQLRAGQWTGRISLLNALVDFTDPGLDQLRDALDQVAAVVPTFQGISDFFTVKNQWIQYCSLAGQWEPGQWTLTAEAAYIDGPEAGFGTSSTAGYLSLARQFGDWQPYVVLNRLRAYVTDDRVVDLVMNTYQPLPLGVPAGVSADLDTLRHFSILAATAAEMTENVYSIGIRYELMPKWALKGQVDWIRLGDGTLGQFNTRGAEPYPDSAILYSITLDTVF